MIQFQIIVGVMYGVVCYLNFQSWTQCRARAAFEKRTTVNGELRIPECTRDVVGMEARRRSEPFRYAPVRSVARRYGDAVARLPRAPTTPFADGSAHRRCSDD